MFDELLTLGVLVALSALVGAVLAVPVTLSVLVGVTIWAALQFVRLLRLRQSLPGNEAAPVSPKGIWSDIHQRIDSLTHENDKGRSPDWRASLEESMAKLPYGFVAITRSRHIKWFNVTAARLLHLSQPDDIGRKISHLIRQPEFELVLENEEDYAEVDLKVGGRHLAAYSSAFGDGAYRLIVIQDMSRVRYLERARSEMLANVAHELKTPLTVISGYAEIISQAAVSPGDDKVVDAAAQVARQAERMNRLIDDLLALERLDESQSPAEQGEAVNLRNLANETVAEMAVIKSDKQCKIKIDIADDVVIHGRSREFRSLLSNLISNAMRYSPATGTVRVSWFHDDEGGHLAVLDEGPGIEAVHLPRLTERFYRADKSRSRGLGGTGLGLAIVKRVLQRHGASLRIESELGRGSVFYCDFPPG